MYIHITPHLPVGINPSFFFFGMMQVGKVGNSLKERNKSIKIKKPPSPPLLDGKFFFFFSSRDINSRYICSEPFAGRGPIHSIACRVVVMRQTHSLLLFFCSSERDKACRVVCMYLCMYVCTGPGPSTRQLLPGVTSREGQNFLIYVIQFIDKSRVLAIPIYFWSLCVCVCVCGSLNCELKNKVARRRFDNSVEGDENNFSWQAQILIGC